MQQILLRTQAGRGGLADKFSITTHSYNADCDLPNTQFVVVKVTSVLCGGLRPLFNHTTVSLCGEHKLFKPAVTRSLPPVRSRAREDRLS